MLTLFMLACSTPLDQDPNDVGQGPPPSEVSVAVTDRFAYTPTEVDVLFVIDNTNSMAAEQNRLIAAFPRMLAALDSSNADYHVGVISTDMSDTMNH